MVGKMRRKQKLTWLSGIALGINIGIFGSMALLWIGLFWVYQVVMCVLGLLSGVVTFVFLVEPKERITRSNFPPTPYRPPPLPYKVTEFEKEERKEVKCG